MLRELKRAIGQDVADLLSMKLWRWLLDMCDIKKYSTNLTYRNDFERYPTPDGVTFEEGAHNDWRKSQWKLELENMLYKQPWLLLPGEKQMIEKWMQLEREGKELPATYDPKAIYTPQGSIKNMDYYDKGVSYENKDN